MKWMCRAGTRQMFLLMYRLIEFGYKTILDGSTSNDWDGEFIYRKVFHLVSSNAAMKAA